MNKLAFCLLTLGMLGSELASRADIFFPTQMGSGTDVVTNVLTPIPTSGILLINYDFFQIPDRLEVFYDGARLFDSDFVSGAGQFAIPYGPGSSDSLFIIMNENQFNPDTNWQYTPSIAPIPEPGLLAFCTLSVLAILARNHRPSSARRGPISASRPA